MPRILSAATALPAHRLDQVRAREEISRLTAGHPRLERLVSVFDRSGVKSRYLVHPATWYTQSRSFEERNEQYVIHALALAEQAAGYCLFEAGILPSAVDHLYLVTTTGLATPSLDALLAERLGFRADVRRSPLFGLGCAGGAGGLIRASDVLTGRPAGLALVVSVELCSLVFSTDAREATDLVGAALFGDGAAAVLLAGDEVASTGPAIAATRSRLFTDARHLMGWQFTNDGMRLVLSRDIASYVRDRVAPVVTDFLSASGTCIERLTHHLLHPGGPKVMMTYRTAFGLADSALDVARRCMQQYGNLSSAAVLFMLSDLLASGRPQTGDTGLMLALGPGFAAEMLTLSW